MRDSGPWVDLRFESRWVCAMRRSEKNGEKKRVQGQEKGDTIAIHVHVQGDKSDDSQIDGTWLLTRHRRCRFYWCQKEK
jgi:hypothetical protein